MLLWGRSPQFLAWDTFARHRVDMIGRKDHGDRVIAHEFDYSIKQQVCLLWLRPPPASTWCARLSLQPCIAVMLHQHTACMPA